METVDKSKIIEAIQQTDDERVLFAIKRLLLIEEEAEILKWHKEELDKRNKRIDAGLEKLHDWRDISEEIKRLD